jgi:uncharacterized OB-fold protein
MQRSIDPLLFDWPSEEPRLIGSECQDCGVVNFPRQAGCPRCCGSNVVLRRLATKGRLWTWTTQEFPPKPPYALAASSDAFIPFKVGYVELPGEVIVESRIATTPARPLSIGMDVKLTIEPLFTDPTGTEVMCFAFAPVQEGA